MRSALMRKEEYRETAYLPWPLDRFDCGRADGAGDAAGRWVQSRGGARSIRRTATAWTRNDMVWMLSRTLAGHGAGPPVRRRSWANLPEAHRDRSGHASRDGRRLGRLARSRRRAAGSVCSRPSRPSAPPKRTGRPSAPGATSTASARRLSGCSAEIPQTNSFRNTIEPRLAAFLRNMVRTIPINAPTTAGSFLRPWTGLKVELWGEKKWRVFEMPAVTS